MHFEYLARTRLRSTRHDYQRSVFSIKGGWLSEVQHFWKFQYGLAGRLTSFQEKNKRTLICMTSACLVDIILVTREIKKEQMRQLYILSITQKTMDLGRVAIKLKFVWSKPFGSDINVQNAVWNQTPRNRNDCKFGTTQDPEKVEVFLRSGWTLSSSCKKRMKRTNNLHRLFKKDIEWNFNSEKQKESDNQ